MRSSFLPTRYATLLVVSREEAGGLCDCVSSLEEDFFLLGLTMFAIFFAELVTAALTLLVSSLRLPTPTVS